MSPPDIKVGNIAQPSAKVLPIFHKWFDSNQITLFVVNIRICTSTKTNAFVAKR